MKVENVFYNELSLPVDFQAVYDTLAVGMPVVIVGRPGCGKTALFWRLKQQAELGEMSPPLTVMLHWSQLSADNGSVPKARHLPSIVISKAICQLLTSMIQEDRLKTHQLYWEQLSNSVQNHLLSLYPWFDYWTSCSENNKEQLHAFVQQQLDHKVMVLLNRLVPWPRIRKFMQPFLAARYRYWHRLGSTLRWQHRRVKRFTLLLNEMRYTKVLVCIEDAPPTLDEFEVLNYLHKGILNKRQNYRPFDIWLLISHPSNAFENKLPSEGMRKINLSNWSPAELTALLEHRLDNGEHPIWKYIDDLLKYVEVPRDFWPWVSAANQLIEYQSSLVSSPDLSIDSQPDIPQEIWEKLVEEMQRARKQRNSSASSDFASWLQEDAATAVAAVKLWHAQHQDIGAAA